MAWIKWIADDEATGPVQGIYKTWMRNNPGRSQMPDILKCFSLRPDLLQSVIDISYPLQFTEGFLTRRQKEMIATFVSALNQCRY
jgi:hypothetical protein